MAAADIARSAGSGAGRPGASARPPGGWPLADSRALGRPYVRDGRPDGDDIAPPRGGRHAGLAAAAVSGERAVIGDSIRIPVAWCQVGRCVAWHADPDALGEADVRARAMASGWCADLFGRLVCPDCQRRYPVWSARPLALPARRAAGAADAWPAAPGRHRRGHERRSAWIMPA